MNGKISAHYRMVDVFSDLSFRSEQKNVFIDHRFLLAQIFLENLLDEGENLLFFVGKGALVRSILLEIERRI